MVWRNRFEVSGLPQAIPVAPGGMQAALSAATGGEYFVLEPGEHGPLYLKNRKLPRPVIIDGPGAILGSVLFEACENFDLRNVTMTGAYEAVAIGLGICRWMAVRGCAGKSVRMKSVAGFIIEKNTLIGADGGGALNVGIVAGEGATSGRVIGNVVKGCVDDHMKIQGSATHIWIEGNLLTDFTPEPPGIHKDGIQITGTLDATPRNIVIRRNHIRDVAPPRNTETTPHWPDVSVRNHPQGIFVHKQDGMPRFTNLRIEENVIDVGDARALSISGGGDGCVIRRNTIRPKGTMDKLAGLYVEYTAGNVQVTDNIAQALIRTDSSSPDVQVSRNHIYGAGTIFPAYDGTLAAAIPLPEAGIPDSVGATAWIRSQLLAG